MSEDYSVENVGTGQAFALEDGSSLTYSKTHNYMLASTFTAESIENAKCGLHRWKNIYIITVTFADRYRGTDVFRRQRRKCGNWEPVLADGAELTYAADASYCLMNDIPIDMENIWNFPSDFTGSITSSADSARTIPYIMQKPIPFMCITRYQLALMQEEDSDGEPVSE